MSCMWCLGGSSIRQHLNSFFTSTVRIRHPGFTSCLRHAVLSACGTFVQLLCVIELSETPMPSYRSSVHLYRCPYMLPVKWLWPLFAWKSFNSVYAVHSVTTANTWDSILKWWVIHQNRRIVTCKCDVPVIFHCWSTCTWQCRQSVHPSQCLLDILHAGPKNQVKSVHQPTWEYQDLHEEVSTRPTWRQVTWRTRVV